MMGSSIRYQFPDPIDADKDGLIAVGGNLSKDCLLSAYSNGIFPWFNEGDPILWWSPDPRMVIFPDRLRINRSVRRAIKNHPFNFTFDHAFEQVIINCSAPRKSQQTGQGSWITEAMIEAYLRLHELGHAHSIECWQDGQLCGGVYGVALGKVFYGESMFSKVSGASKLALVSLIKQLNDWEFKLFDCQMPSELVKRLGAVQLPRRQFTELVRRYTSDAQPQSWRQHQPVSLQ